jgi:TPR repeat protein
VHRAPSWLLSQSGRAFVPPTPFAQPNLPRRLAALKKLAANGNADAECRLANRYETGDGVARNPQLAERWLVASAAKHNGCGINELGKLYVDARGVPRNYRLALDYFRAAASGGYPGAYYNLGVMAEYGWGVDRNDRDAFVWYKKAADSGYPQAFTAVADYYLYGNAGIQDTWLAEQYYTLSAKAGDTYAADRLAYAYIRDARTPDHIKKAMHWLKRDAESPWAQYELGWLYDTGDGVTKDAKLAARWYRRAANQGLPDALTAYADLLRTGRIDHRRNFVSAADYYRKAVAAGDGKAMFELGEMCGSGSGVPRDPRLAERLYASAAAHGNGDALLLIAYRFLYGTHGYPRDLERAEALAIVAASHGASERQIDQFAPLVRQEHGASVSALISEYERSIEVYAGDSMHRRGQFAIPIKVQTTL